MTSSSNVSSPLLHKVEYADNAYLLVGFSIVTGQPHVMENTHLAGDDFR